MKAKHIITTCGIILGGLAVTQGASAVVTYRDSSFVQFTFAPTLGLTLSSSDLKITNLAPNTEGKSDAITANVTSNNLAGYLLTATVGGSTTDLTSAAGSFEMIDSSATALSAGKWGITTDDGATYKALSTSTGTTIHETNSTGNGSQQVKIGAYAAAAQPSGTYTNTINFAVTSKVATYTIAAAKGTNAAAATVAGKASETFNPGNTPTITATCSSGTFNRWEVTGVGTVASETSATTTFTVGNGNATVTAYCN